MTEAQKRANAKWQKKNMTSLSCSLTKKAASRYKELAAAKGLTIQRIFLDALKALEE